MSVSSATVKINESKRKKREAKKEASLKYYRENKERINSQRRERRKKIEEPEQWEHREQNNGDTARRLKWKLDKRRQRAKAKEESHCQNELEARKNSQQAHNNEPGTSSSTFSSRMHKKRTVDRVKENLPRSPAKRAAVVATLMESPTTRKGLEHLSLGAISPNDDETQVALAALCDAKEDIDATKTKQTWSTRLTWQ